MDCQAINATTDGQSDRVQQIDAAAPECACEAHRMSEHSPGPVAHEEKLSRFILLPHHIDKKGRAKPNLFSHVANKGCSVQREDRAGNAELAHFVRRFLESTPNARWSGVVIGHCGTLRAFRIGSGVRRTLCVYDTAEPHNPAHAEICRTAVVADDEGDLNEARKHLLDCFGGGRIEVPERYRGGGVLAQMASRP